MVYSANRFLTRAEMTVNAQYILDDLLAKGWTKEAVCGMLGNMETESTINPGIWQNLDSGNMNMGFGLVQWTPASKFTNWADSMGYEWGDIDGQIARIQYEKANNVQWIATSTYNFSFETFSKSTQSVEYLADAFLKCYERPADQNQPNRGTQARYWYDNLSGEGGGTVNFIYPTDCPVSSPFRPPDRPDHYGVDFACTGDNEIKASAGGTVSQSYYSDSYGEVVMILHNIDGQEYETVYAHMRSGTRTVSQGDTVTQGQVLGIMGDTGDSDGQHLHFELHVGRWNSSKSNAVDPIPYLGTSSGGGGETPTTNKNKDLIHLLLSDALNGWKW
ncbi:peptidase [Cytobacillus phage Bfsp1]|nr:peptidase [Cytobacillus phage Bfsp1]